MSCSDCSKDGFGSGNIKAAASTADPCECNATIQSTAKGFAAREFNEVEEKKTRFTKYGKLR